MNAGIALQAKWRWNGRPLRIRIVRKTETLGYDRTPVDVWRVTWQRYFPRDKTWREWRSYVGFRSLREAIYGYREYANYWRGLDD
jgi:hypothetical protein